MANADNGELIVEEEGPNGKLFTNGIILINNGRFSYPYVDQLQTQKDDDGNETQTNSVRLLVPKRTHRWVKDLCVRRINELCIENKIGPNFKIKELAADKKFIWDGDRRAAPEVEKGMWRIAARAYEQVPLLGNTVDANGKIIRIKAGKAAKEFFYGGARGAIMIRPWFSSKKGNRVTAALVSVQFRGHDARFGEGRISDNALDSGGWDTDGDAGAYDADDDDI